GALGSTAPSAGRRAALQQVGRSMVLPPGRDGSEDWLQSWQRRPHISAPFATDYSVKEAPMELRWCAPMGAKGPSLTAERILIRGGRENLIALTAAAAKDAAAAAAAASGGVKAAGAGSGHGDGDLGRLGVLNGSAGVSRYCQ
ncbi:unnamed protein product, partial [Polarella glacialis]